MFHDDSLAPDEGGDRDGDVPPVPVRFDWTAAESPSAGVIDAVAAASGTPPERMRPLNDSVDPDALDEVFGPVADDHPPSAQLSLSFSHEGFDVTVYRDGQVVVRTTDDRP